MASPNKKPAYVTAPDMPFTPCYMFFYGSLMDPSMFTLIAQPATTPPVLRPATLTGYSMKMWSVYPTLITCPGSTIRGLIWKCETEAEFLKLQRYESDMYTWALGTAELDEGGEVLKDIRVFVWSGDADSEDLREGEFDLNAWREGRAAWRI